MTTELNMDDIGTLIDRVARNVRRKFPTAEYEDLCQEVWVWIVENQPKVESWASDEDGGWSKLWKSGYHRAMEFASGDKAQKDGYEQHDNFYYSLSLLRRALPYWYADRELVLPDGGRKDHILPDRDLYLDIRTGVESLRPEDSRMLYNAFSGDDVESWYQALASQLEVSVDAARARVNRSLRKLQEAIGGEAPTFHKKRKVLSNAAAAAITSHSYDD